MRKILLAAAFAALPFAAQAQPFNAVGGHVDTSPPSNTVGIVVPFSITPNGGLRVQSQDGAGNDVGASHPLPVVEKSPAAAYVTPGCTVGTSSGLCLASGTATNHITLQNTSASASIACSWGGTATLNSIGSFMLTPGQPATWGVNTGGVPPAAALNCIASAASTPLYVEYN